MKNTNKKYGYFTEGVFYEDNSGSIFSSDIFIVFFQKLFSKRKIWAIGRLSKKEFSPKYLLAKDTSLTKLSLYKSITRLLLFYPLFLMKNRNKINSFIKNIDILFISASGPLSIHLLRKIKKENKQVIIFVRQDTRKLVSVKHNNSFSAKILANLIETYIENFVENYSKSTVFTFGNEIYNRYSKKTNSVYPIADSRFQDSDIINAEDLVKIDYSMINFLYVGRLAFGKGLEFLIKSLSLITNFEFKLTIIGDGVLKEKLIDLVNVYKLTESVNFKGHIYFGKELLNEYSSHDILVLPSFSEGFPQVIIEAMARGILVVATKVGGIPDLIQDGVNGFLFTAGNQNEFLKIINKIRSNAIPTDIIRGNGLHTAKKYSFESQSQKIYHLINS